MTTRNFLVQSTTMKKGLNTLSDFMAGAWPEELNDITSADTHLNNVVIQADSCKYDVDLADLWVTPYRWNVLTRQYLDPLAVDRFVDLIDKRMGKKSRGTAFLRTNDVGSRGTTKVSRIWGSCMLGFGWRSAPTPELTMHSRTSYIGGLSALDIGVAHKLAELIGERVGLTTNEIKFTWFIETAQFHYFRCLAWWFANPERVALLKKRGDTNQVPTAYGTQKVINKFLAMDEAGKRYDEEAYRSFGMKRRAWHIATQGVDYANQFGEGARELKHVKLSSLDLSAIYKPNPASKPSKKKAGFIGADDGWD